MNQICQICLETIKITKYFQCEHCKKSVCKNCLKESIITYNTTNIPKCPDCQTSIPFELLAKIYSKKFIKEDLINHLTEIEFNILTKEKSKLIIETLALLCQDTSNYQEHQKYLLFQQTYNNILYYPKPNSNIQQFISPYLEDIISKQINHIDQLQPDQLQQIEIELLALQKLIQLSPNQELIDKYFQPLISNIKNIHYLPSYTKKGLTSAIKHELSLNDKKQNYLLRCTECELGFITTKFKCTNCKKQFCDKCLIEITHNPQQPNHPTTTLNSQQPPNNQTTPQSTTHQCTQQNIDNFQFILSNTKPCPNCYTRISKISGCNQMFCTFCHKGFDWVTGKLIKSNFHNPHRMEWLNNGGIDNLNDNECINNYAYQVIGKSNITQQINRLLFYNNHCNQLIQNYTSKLNNITDELTSLTNLSMYLYHEYIQKHSTQSTTTQHPTTTTPPITQPTQPTQHHHKQLTLTQQKFKQILKHNEINKFKYELYLETYQNIVDLCTTVLIRIDQILCEHQKIKEFMDITYNVKNNQTTRYNPETIRILKDLYGYKIEVRNFGVIISNQYQEEINKYVTTIPQINSLISNCYKLLKEIETKRIDELEKYLDLKFDRYVYDIPREYNIYFWSTKYGFSSINEMIEWHQILISKPDENYIEYELIDPPEYSKLAIKIRKINEILGLKRHSHQNVCKLPLSNSDKMICYSIIKK